jgi:hypothetical protein
MTIITDFMTHCASHGPRSRFRIRRSNESGSILITAVIFAALVGLALVAYLSLIKSQHTLTHRSKVWNDCIPLCEAGIEDALAHLNFSGTTTFGINGWVFNANAYHKELTLNNGTIRVAISNDLPPTIFASSSLRAPLSSSSDITRTIRVGTRTNESFPYAILTRGRLICNSSGGRVDSYDSTNPLKSTLGRYDPAKAGDQAHVVTISRDPSAIEIGTLSVYGYAGTGPGGSIGITGGNVGSTLFNDNTFNDGKIEAGHVTDDINVYIPDPTLPGNFTGALSPGSGTVAGTNYTYVLPSGNWTLNSLKLGTGQRMIVTGNAHILVTGSTAISGSGGIDIAAGGSLEFYTTGDVDIKGNVNNLGVPKDFSLVGLNGCKNITYSGGASYVGTINAPGANVTIAGGSVFSGAIIANTAKITGGLSVHYDEALKAPPGEGRFLVASYQEL